MVRRIKKNEGGKPVTNKTGKVQVNNMTTHNVSEPNKIVKVEGERKRFIDRCIDYGRERERYNREPRGWDRNTLLGELNNLLQSHHSHLLSTLGRKVREEVDELRGVCIKEKHHPYETECPCQERADELEDFFTALLSSMEEVKS